MPKREDLKKILIIGSGPIVIGQACEFDYSGTQACKALREEGYEVVLVNSNPATIMTDPEFAEATYIEPITADIVEKIIEKERPDAILPTIGGQTGLNVSIEVADRGVLEKYGVEMIGATPDVIKTAEDRELFKKAMGELGLNVPLSGFARNTTEAMSVADEIGSYPLIIRPSFTLGGVGGGIAYNVKEYESMAKKGIDASPIDEILVEESVIGWKEYELEVMRDKNDNVVIVCSIENLDPMGVHTGDSITVAPAQTLTDKEYQMMRNAAIAIIRKIGVETGGSNIQFAINPENGEMIIIEMNPRVSRSSALASKATGFPIAKFAAKLAVGYTLDEISNDITKKTPACFEPTIDYCVTKIPRWAFEKFPDAEPILTTQMKSVGEAMAIGRTFKESLQKALRSLEIGRFGLGADGKDEDLSYDEIRRKLIVPQPDRIFAVRLAMLEGMTVDEIHNLSKIDSWFLYNIEEIVVFEKKISENSESIKKDFSYKDIMKDAKRMGFSDYQIAYLLNLSEKQVRERRDKIGLNPTYHLVDTCAGEFESYTPYYYSSYETMDEVKPSSNKKIMILGGGPNRIGQGIEFDYCCVHASFALKEDGYETIMVNSNPETVSTDYDTSDRLYFEPLTLEDVLSIYNREKCHGVIVQLGGQTPLNLAEKLEKEGVNIIGTSPDSIDIAEDRERFQQLVNKLGVRQPENGIARSVDEAKIIARDVGYPVVVRPSYVLGGRAMEIVYDEDSLENYMKFAVSASPEKPILIDRFLENAIEVDVDAISDGEDVVIGAVMEHIEEAGIHSGDSACVIPPFSLSNDIIKEAMSTTVAFAKALKVRGLINIQYAVKDDILYVLEVNPRASRTVPFVSKVIGVPIAKMAAKVMAGKTLSEVGFTETIVPEYFSVKEAILPFDRFPGVDILLGPEMRSTGEVMGVSYDYGVAFGKTQMGFNKELPLSGKVFISVKNQDKRNIVFVAKKLADFGFKIVATEGTAKILRNNGLDVQQLYKIKEGRPNILDLMINQEISLIINTPGGKRTRQDEAKIRSTGVSKNILCVTTISGANAVINGIESLLKKGLTVTPIQDYHKTLKSNNRCLN